MDNWHADDWTLTPEDGETLPERAWTPLAPRDNAAAAFGRDYATRDWVADAQALAHEDAEEAELQRMLEEAEQRWRPDFGPHRY
jgi:hypothetical protein